MKAAHHASTDSVVKKHNKKYNEMLAERMAAEERVGEKVKSQALKKRHPTISLKPNTLKPCTLHP
jgi:hypothetical protein